MLNKSFTITYNHKKFLILVDKNHQKTFLEVTNDGKYIYPSHEDYVALYNMYNNNYNSNIFAGKKKISYKEKMRYKAGALVLAIGVYGFCLGSAIKADLKNRASNIEHYQRVQQVSRDSSTLAELYGYQWITRDDVIEVINNNDNLNAYYKQIAIDVLDNLLALDPYINLRIYYENMKDIKVTELTYEELVEMIHVSAAGCYFRQTNEIYLATEYLQDYVISAHEFTHAAFSFSDIIKNKRIVIGDDYGFSLNEAMTQLIVANRWGNNGSYVLQQLLLTFFLENMHNFDYHTYNEESIIGVINDLKAEYPDIDIDYLIDFIDKFTNQQQESEDIHSICEIPKFCNELFKIAIKNIDKNAIYKAFNTFIAIFNYDMNVDFYNKYFTLYNQELVNQGLITQAMYDQLEDVNSLCLINDNFYLGNNGHYYDYDGRMINEKVKLTIPINEYSKTKLLQALVLGNNIYSSEYIYSLLSDENLLDYACIVYIRTLDEISKKELIDGTFNYMTRYIDQNNLYDTFNAFTLYLTSDYKLFSEYSNYLTRYDQIVSELFALDSNMIRDVRNIKYLIRSNNIIYPCINYESSYQRNYTIWHASNDLGDEFAKVHFGNNSIYSYISATGIYKDIMFNEEVVDYFCISKSGTNKLIQYIANNHITNIWQVNEFNKMLNYFGIDNSERELLFKGSAINVDDYYVAFGHNGKGIGIILYDNDNNYIYGTCEELKDNICYLPLRTFAKLGDEITINWENLEWIISNEYLKSIPNIALEYFVPNVNVTIEETISHDSVGNAMHGSEKIISYNNYGIIMVNGIKDYARHIYLYTDGDNNLLIHFFDEDRLLENVDGISYPLDSYYFFDKCLAYYNMLYEDAFTKEQVIDIFENYVKDVCLERNRTY